jgi:SAM-dependent methyltransferase
MTSRDETGARLHSLYGGDVGVRSAFTVKVDDYAARPSYPPDLFALLASRYAPSPAALVVDVGAGTGLLTRGLLDAGYRVVAVEPNAKMRASADAALSANERYRSVVGAAEALPLDAQSAELIVAAQAFHWFDIERARPEFLRVLEPHGAVGLIWNDRVLDDPLQQACSAIFAEFGGEKRAALSVHQERGNLPLFFGATQPEAFSWPNEQRLDERRLTQLLLSRSYMPTPGSEAAVLVAERAGALFRDYALDGAVSVRYRTVLFLGRPAP